MGIERKRITVTALAADLTTAAAPPTEGELLLRAQAGDMDAFGDLQARLTPAIRRFVWRLVGDHDEQEDVIQDSLIALYLNLDRVQPIEKLRPYLFRIVRNRCYDLLRKRRRREQISLDDEPVELWASLEAAQDEQPPDEATHWLLLRAEVMTAVDRLPELQRQALILYAEENLSYAEIAEVMQTSLGTIKSRIFHAKQLLRRRLRPETVQHLESEFGLTSA